MPRAACALFIFLYIYIWMRYFWSIRSFTLHIHKHTLFLLLFCLELSFFTVPFITPFYVVYLVYLFYAVICCKSLRWIQKKRKPPTKWRKRACYGLLSSVKCYKSPKSKYVLVFKISFTKLTGIYLYIYMKFNTIKHRTKMFNIKIMQTKRFVTNALWMKN